MQDAGTDLKYKVTPLIEELSLDESDFTIEVLTRWGNSVCSIPKSECLSDDGGNYFFMVENIPSGTLLVRFTAYMPDDDFSKGTRKLVDKQVLYGEECMCDIDCDCKKEDIVTYEQVWTADVDGEIYLVGYDGSPILTKDGKKITFKKK